MLRVLGHRREAQPPGAVITGNQAVALCFLLALMTGMRAGELCAIGWPDVHEDFVRLRTSKTGVGRDVPLTASARRVIERLRGRNEERVIGLKPEVLDALFRKARVKAGLAGFTFHDARHTAATRIAQRLHVLDLCRMFGWSKTDRAMTYYQPRASDIARRLAG
jgi:integrase